MSMPTFKLMVAMVTFLLLGVTVSSAMSLSTPVTGCSFFWLTATGTSQIAKDQMKVAFQRDMQEAADTTVVGLVVDVTDLKVNATAMFVEYTLLPSAGASAAQPSIMASTLPRVNQLVAESKNALQEIGDLFPTEVRFTTDVLYPLPSDIPEPEPVIVSSTASTHVMFVSGSDAVWRKVIDSDDDRHALSTAFLEATVNVVYRPLMITDVGVSSFEAQSAGQENSMGGNESGLILRLSIIQRLERGAHRAYTADELNSVLLMMDLTVGVDPIYAANNGGTNVPLSVVAVASAESEGKMVCTGLCKGMIAMGAVAGAIMVFILIGMIAYSCCCGEKKPKGESFY